MQALSVNRPASGAFVGLNQPFQVSGTAATADPNFINAVTVEVAGGASAPVQLTPVADPRLNIFRFTTTATISSGADPHLITVTASDDMGVMHTETISVNALQQPPVLAGPPALLLEIQPAPLDPTSPDGKARLDALVSQVQLQLMPFASLLASIGRVLVGPNVVVQRGSNVLRVAMWILDSSFPTIAANPPQFPLPVLADDVATNTLTGVPGLPLPSSSGLQFFSFGFAVAKATLDELVAALMPVLKAKATGQSASLDSVTVALNKPGSITTTLSGRGGWPVASVSATITESLGTLAIPGPPAQSIPVITGSTFSSSTDVFSQVVLGFLCPVFWAEALVVTIGVPVVGGSLASKASGIASTIVASIPRVIPFRNSGIAGFADFPVVIPNWTFFGVTDAAVLGLGTGTLAARDQNMVSMSLSGPRTFVGSQSDLAGGASLPYSLTWSNLLPDPDKFTWAVSGSGTDNGSVSANALALAASVLATFPLPFRPAVGSHPFTLAVNAVETSGLDPSKVLMGSAELPVTLSVAKDPVTPLAVPLPALAQE